jgi:hypothetical protein
LKFDREELRKLSKDQLIDITLELAEKVDQLTRRIDELERAAARSAAPFSKGKGKKNKKRPGRKKGQGVFGRRKEPEIRPSDTIENVKAPLKSKLQQKCLSHLLKNLSEVEKSKQGRAKCFTRKLMKILRSGLQVWQEYRAGKIGLSRFRRRGRKLKKELDHHLRDRILSDEDNQRMLDGIGWQNDKGRVFLFLDIPEVEPTNNRAERGLRPAIIARKVSQCSKNETGARIFETMKSITATLVLRGVNVAAGLAAMMKGAPMPEGQAGR